MPEYIRALIAILFIASLTYLYAKKALQPMLLPEEYKRWRNAWFVITLLAFLSQNFWVFTALSSLYLLYVAKSEQNKFALYFALVIIIPTISARIPNLFELNFVRLLALTILLPYFIAFRASSDSPSFGKPLAEKFLLVFMLLNTLMMMRGTSFTDALRYGFYGITDVFLPYFAASRAIKDFDQLKKVMIAFTLACLIASVIAMYEFTNSWLLYNSLQDALHVDWSMGRYLGRGDSLRAIASLGHSIILGFVMMVGMGFYLFLAPSIKNKFLRLAGLGLIIGGLISSLSRGPWLGAAILLLTLVVFGRKAIKRLALLIIIIVIAVPALHWIPGGQKVINLIPFIGETDKDNVVYRQKLIDNSIIIIERYPLFGVYNPKDEPEMAEMVQGEGIIDIVNTYLAVALYNGLVGLALLLGFFSMVVITLLKRLRRITDKESEEYLCGRTLLAILMGVFVTIFTVSSIGVIPTVYWSLAGLVFSYARITGQPRASKTGQKSVEKPVYSTSRLKSEV